MRNFLLLLLVHLTLTLSAQAVNPDRNRVIATGGLSLRAAPSPEAAALSVLDYNAVVEVLDTAGRSIGDVDTLHSVTHYDYATDDFALQPVTGRYLRVTDGRDTGYVFDAYLWYDYAATDQPAEEPATLFFRARDQPGTTLPQPERRDWHGIYRADGATGWEIRPLTFTYVVGDHRGFAAPYAVYSATEDLVFVFGTPRTAPDGYAGRAVHD